MVEILKFLGFTFLVLRFFYWFGLSLASSQSFRKNVLIAQSFEGILIYFICTQLLGTTSFLPMPQTMWTAIAGFLLLALGVSGMFLAKQQLGSAWVHAVAYRVVSQQQLTTKGLYGLVRHPMYTCFVISYVGAELLAGSWLWISMLFLFIPLYFQAKREEKLLAKHFGAKYEEYQKKTKMLIPKVL